MATANFSDRLKKALDLRGMKQSELADKSGLDKTSITSYLKGRYKANAKSLYAMAKVLNVSEAWLMGLDVPMERRPAAETDSGRAAEFVELFKRLSSDQQDFIIASIRGLLQAQE